MVRAGTRRPVYTLDVRVYSTKSGLVWAALTCLLCLVALLLVTDFAYGKSPSKASVTAIKGQEKWITVGGLRGERLHLKASRQWRKTAGFLAFPEGRLPDDGRRDYVGTTIATIKVRPTSEVRNGIDILWSSVGSWPYSMVKVKRTKKRSCPNAVEWNSYAIISGSQSGIACNGTIRIKTVNVLTYGSVRPGPKRWSFHVERLGRQLIESVKISKRSKIGITRRTPSKMVMSAPKSFDLPDGKASSVLVGLKNIGGRRSKGLRVTSWIENKEFVVAHERSRKVHPLAPGKSRQVRIPVARAPEGDYILFLSVESDNGDGDALAYRVEGGPPDLAGRLSRVRIPKATPATDDRVLEASSEPVDRGLGVPYLR